MQRLTSLPRLGTLARGPRATRTTFAFALTAAAVAACGPLSDSQSGALDNGTFSYNCTTQEDAYCADDSLLGSTIPTIAYGAEFQMAYATNGDTNLEVVPASPDFFAQEGDNYKALLVGTASFLAVTPSGDAVDLTSVTVAPITSVQIASTGFSVNLAGTNATYDATPMGLVGALAGTVAFDWSSSDDSVVEITSANGAPAGSVGVTFVKAGTATLTASTSTATGSLVIHVEAL